VTKVIEFLAKNHQDSRDYEELLGAVLKLVTCPPRIEKPSESHKFKHDLEDYFTMYGEILIINCGAARLLL
jgi:hypothetical protein